MYALPFAIALLAALVLAPPLVGMLTRGEHVRPNHRGSELPTPLGILVPAAALTALVPLMLIEQFAGKPVFHPYSAIVALYALGVLLLGLIDDALGAGAGAPRGIRGHAAAARRGELSTGALKAAGSLGLALLAVRYLPLSGWRWLLAAGVLVLRYELFNLLDLRPGRAVKVFVVLGVGPQRRGRGPAQPLDAGPFRRSGPGRRRL